MVTPRHGLYIYLYLYLQTSLASCNQPFKHGLLDIFPFFSQLENSKPRPWAKAAVAREDLGTGYSDALSVLGHLAGLDSPKDEDSLKDYGNWYDLGNMINEDIMGFIWIRIL